MEISHIIKSKASKKVFTLDAGISVQQAASEMAERNFGAVLVSEETKITGIFTERDLMRCVASHEGNLGKTTLKEVMTENPKTISSTQNIWDAFDMMMEGRFRHLPVTHAGKLVGIISYIDIIKWLIPGTGRKSGFRKVEGFLSHNAGSVIGVFLFVVIAFVLIIGMG